MVWQAISFFAPKAQLVLALSLQGLKMLDRNLATHKAGLSPPYAFSANSFS